MIYFISDVHLGHQERSIDRKREDLLIMLLKRALADASHLVIAGDLFDYWFDYKTVIPRYFYRSLSALSEIKDNNIKIDYLMGNHDFGHFDFFKSEMGIDIHENDIEFEAYSRKFYIAHGDGKDLNDKPYLMMKKILRNPSIQKFYRLLHPNCGIGLALATSRKSRHYTSDRHYPEPCAMVSFAEQKIAEGYDYVVMGHRHRQIVKQSGSGYYINLGDWLSEPTFGLFDGKEFHLLKVREYLGLV